MRRVALLGRVWPLWVEMVRRRRVMKNTIRLFTGHRTRRTAVRCIAAWRAHTEESKALKRAGVRVLRMWTQGTLSRCFRAWASVAQAAKHERHVIAQFSARWRNRWVWLAFSAWSGLMQRKRAARQRYDQTALGVVSAHTHHSCNVLLLCAQV